MAGSWWPIMTFPDHFWFHLNQNIQFLQCYIVHKWPKWKISQKRKKCKNRDFRVPISRDIPPKCWQIRAPFESSFKTVQHMLESTMLEYICFESSARYNANILWKIEQKGEFSIVSGPRGWRYKIKSLGDSNMHGCGSSTIDIFSLWSCFWFQLRPIDKFCLVTHFDYLTILDTIAWNV